MQNRQEFSAHFCIDPPVSPTKNAGHEGRNPNSTRKVSLDRDAPNASRHIRRSTRCGGIWSASLRETAGRVHDAGQCCCRSWLVCQLCPQPGKQQAPSAATAHRSALGQGAGTGAEGCQCVCRCHDHGAQFGTTRRAITERCRAADHRFADLRFWTAGTLARALRKSARARS